MTEVQVIEGPRPIPKQDQAFRSPATFILYGGAMGGGKTHWLCTYGVELSLRYPGNRGYLCRHELKSFKRSTLITLEQDVLPTELIRQHNRTDQFISFHNGSTIYYGGLGDDQRAIERLKSMELGWWGIDQAEETSESFFFMLASRLRLRLKGIRYKGLMTANPHPGWLKHRFVDQKIEDHEFIPAKAKDNPYLPEAYIVDLTRTLPPELVRAWIEGDWNVIASINDVFPYAQVIKAMERPPRGQGEIEYGVDVGEYGPDETVLASRQGLADFKILDTWKETGPMQTAGRIAVRVGYDKGKRIKIDAIGPGSGVYDRLLELGYNVWPIRGSEEPTSRNRHRFRNLKTELYWQLRFVLPYASLPKDPVLREEITSARYKVLNSSGLIIVESKEEVRRRGLPSPNRMEAIIYANATPEEGRKGKIYTARRAAREAIEKKEGMSDYDREVETLLERKLESLSREERVRLSIAQMRKPPLEPDEKPQELAPATPEKEETYDRVKRKGRIYRP